MSDLIDRHTAINAIRTSASKYTGFMEMEMYTDDDAVEAIMSVPSTQPDPSQCWGCNCKKMEQLKLCTDLISRQAALDALGDEPMVWTDSDYEIGQRNQWNSDKLAVETVPSAQQKGDITEAIKYIKNTQEYLRDIGETWYADYLSDAIELLVGEMEALPSAQPEIIRCKDCKQFRRWIDTNICFCDITESEISDNDFCSRAERRRG